MMKAIVLEKTGGRDQLIFKDIEKPRLKAGQVLVKVEGAPVNFVDTIIRKGAMPAGMMPHLPFILGVEGSGIVVEPNGTTLRLNQKVA